MAHLILTTNITKLQKIYVDYCDLVDINFKNISKDTKLNLISLIGTLINLTSNGENALQVLIDYVSLKENQEVLTSYVKIALACYIKDVTSMPEYSGHLASLLPSIFQTDSSLDVKSLLDNDVLVPNKEPYYGYLFILCNIFEFALQIVTENDLITLSSKYKSKTATYLLYSFHGYSVVFDKSAPLPKVFDDPLIKNRGKCPITKTVEDLFCYANCQICSDCLKKKVTILAEERALNLVKDDFANLERLLLIRPFVWLHHWQSVPQQSASECHVASQIRNADIVPNQHDLLHLHHNGHSG